MQIYKYKDYKHYKKAQTIGNTKKLDRVWVSRKNIELASDIIKITTGKVRFGICHGTRRGLEQKWFSEILGCKVIGTEISHTAIQFPNTIQWDFHNVKSEWIGSVDFIYSNSLDHSYNPEKCLESWMSCLCLHGICILEWSQEYEVMNETDPFAASLEEYKEMIGKKWSWNIYPAFKHQGYDRILIVISRRS